jgi:hypothetical protein
VGRAPIDHGEEFEIIVSGLLYDGNPFQDSDVIRVINPGGGSEGQFALEVLIGPERNTARINYGLSADGPVTLCIYDVAGRLIRTLMNDHKGTGSHQVTWDCRTDDGRQVGPGVYFVRMQQLQDVTVKKMLIMR